MKYEVSKWYRWGGGECPVHPMSWVEVFIVEEDLLYEDECHAEAFDWNSEEKSIVAFKVAEEYKEPRAYWVVLKKGEPMGTFLCVEDAEDFRLEQKLDEVIEVREVKE